MGCQPRVELIACGRKWTSGSGDNDTDAGRLVSSKPFATESTGRTCPLLVGSVDRSRLSRSCPLCVRFREYSPPVRNRSCAIHRLFSRPQPLRDACRTRLTLGSGGVLPRRVQFRTPGPISVPPQGAMVCHLLAPSAGAGAGSEKVSYERPRLSSPVGCPSGDLNPGRRAHRDLATSSGS